MEDDGIVVGYIKLKYFVAEDYWEACYLDINLNKVDTTTWTKQ